MEKEGYIGFSGHCFGQQGFSGSRRSYQQCTFGDLTSKLRIFLRIFQKFHNLPDLNLGLFQSGHIMKVDFHTGILIKDLGFGFSHTEDVTATGASASAHSAKHVDPDSQDQQKGKHPKHDLTDVVSSGERWCRWVDSQQADHSLPCSVHPQIHPD